MEMPLPPRPRRRLKYKIVVQDEGITVFELRFNGTDFAEFIGGKLAEFLNLTQAIPTDESRMSGMDGFWAGEGYRESPPF